MPQSVTAADIQWTVRDTGLAGKPLEIHASLRSFGRVEGGAPAVVEALLAEGCTVLAPTFSDAFFVMPLPHQRPARNAWGYDRPRPPMPGTDRIFTPRAMEIDRDMGAIPAALLAIPGRVRGNHPLMSFTAAGPLAHALAEGQGPRDAYAPLAALVRHGGAVVLMGVALTEMTFLHYAEAQAGRRPFIRWANGPDGRPMEVQYGGCSDGFERLAPALAHLERVATAGLSRWRCYPARETLAAAVDAIRRDPEITACAERCGRCADAIAGGPERDVQS